MFSAFETKEKVLIRWKMMKPTKHFKMFLLYCVWQTDGTRKTVVFLHTTSYLENKVKCSGKEAGFCLIHLNKPTCEIWSCFGNVQSWPKISLSLFPLNPSIRCFQYPYWQLGHNGTLNTSLPHGSSTDVSKHCWLWYVWMIDFITNDLLYLLCTLK